MNRAEMELWFKGAVRAWVKSKGTYDPELATRVLKEQGMDGLLAELEAAGAL